jgi:hypothetical protein
MKKTILIGQYQLRIFNDGTSGYMWSHPWKNSKKLSLKDMTLHLIWHKPNNSDGVETNGFGTIDTDSSNKTETNRFDNIKTNTSDLNALSNTLSVKIKTK